MKNFLLILLVLFPALSNAQTFKDVARSNEITWYGIDFSHSKFSGFDDPDFEKNMPELIKKGSFAPLTAKQMKFMIDRIDKDDIIKKTDSTEKRNDRIISAELLTDKIYSIDRDSISGIVESYKFHGKGYGILLIAEFFDQKDKFIQIWGAFVDNETGKLINTHRYTVGLDMRITTFRNKWYDAIETLVGNVCKDLKRSK